MTKHHVPKRGDIYWIDPNPVSGREVKNRHRFIIITPKEINKLGIAIAVPITSGGSFSRLAGLTVPIMGHDTTGVAICNQVRSFDIEARERAGTVRYIETIDDVTVNEIINRVISVIDPAV